MFTTATVTTLSAMPYAQAKVIHHCDQSITLRSYKTDVAHITAGGWLYVYGLFSATTRKHIGAFVKEFANISFQTAKMLYNDGYRYNIYTGEVKEK